MLLRQARIHLARIAEWIQIHPRSQKTLRVLPVLALSGISGFQWYVAHTANTTCRHISTEQTDPRPFAGNRTLGYRTDVRKVSAPLG